MRAFAALGVAGALLARGRVAERMRLRGTGWQADSIAVPAWAELSTASFAALVPTP